MQLARADALLAILVQLDVLDMRLDGSYAMNEAFRGSCREAYEAAPRTFDVVVPELILARAAARSVILDLDVEELALTALEAA